MTRGTLEQREALRQLDEQDARAVDAAAQISTDDEDAQYAEWLAQQSADTRQGGAAA